MLRIGEFAWLSQVTVETLRHYARIGLLEPICTDRFTSYRYYSVDQLPRLNRILALKDLGLSLEQIGQVLNEDLSPERIRGMLLLKQAEMGDQIQEARDRLARVEARLRQIELEGKMPDYDVIHKTVQAQKVASRRRVFPSGASMGMTIKSLFIEAATHIEDQGGKQEGPAMSVWHVCPDDPMEEGNEIDFEAAIPVEGSLPESEMVSVHELPTASVASVVHHGSFEEIPQAYRAAFAWVEANGFRVAGPIREIYLKYDEENDPTNNVTEVQIPVGSS